MSQCVKESRQERMAKFVTSGYGDKMEHGADLPTLSKLYARLAVLTKKVQSKSKIIEQVS